MMRLGTLPRIAFVLAAFGLLLPPQALTAGEPVRLPPVGESQPMLIPGDIALGEGGTLRGQVVDAQGVPRTEIPVAIWQNNRQVGATATSADGWFAIRGLRGGTYHVVAEEGIACYRMWAPGTAPPSAQQQVLLVSEAMVARGNFVPPLRVLMANPFVVLGMTAAAIAIPVAVHNQRVDRDTNVQSP